MAKTPKQWTEADVEYIRSLMLPELSLNDTLKGENHEEDDSERGDFIASDEPGPDELSEAACTKRLLLEYMRKCLRPREEMVLKLRFGLIDNRAHTLREIGETFGLTRERIRQIEVVALRKLRNTFRRLGLNKEDF